MSTYNPDSDNNLDYSGEAQPVSYDPNTGAPIYAEEQAPRKPIGYDPNTGAPIYAEEQVPRQPIGYDPNTGAPIYAEEQAPRQPIGYDPNTGAPIYEEAPAGGGRKKAPLGAIIGAVAAAVAVVAAILCFVFLRSTPMEAVTDAMDNTMTAIYSRNDGLALLSRLSDEQNLSITFAADDIASLGEVSAVLYGGYNELEGLNASVSGALSGNKDSEMSMELELNVQGFSTNAQFYLSPKEIVFSAPALLGSSYGLSLENLEERLEASIFAPDSGSDYALSDYDYEQLLAAAESISAASSRTAVSPEDFREALLTAIEKDEDAKPEFEVSKAEVELGGENVKCSVYTTTIDNDSMAAMTRVLAEVIDETMPDMVDMAAESGSDLTQELEALADELEDYGPGKVKLELAVYKDKLVRLDATAKESDQSITIDLGKDPAASDIMSITVSDFEEVTIIYERLENSKDSYEAEVRLEVESEDYSETLLILEHDRESGDFSVTFNDSWDGFTLEGNLITDGKSLTLEPYSITSSYYEETAYIYDCTIAVSAEDTVKKPEGNYIDILDMTEEDIEALMDELYFAAPF